MNWGAISSISDLAGAVMVVATLFYVAAQLRPRVEGAKTPEGAAQ